MHHHIRHLTDIQDLVTHRGEEAYATFLDFEKAYDRVNWTYMFRVLEKMGVGESFIDWVRLLYNNTKAQLMINGNITPSITPQRGVKQGDPLSALLFLMTIEPLGNLLRQHEEHGIGINGTTVATGLFFADDSTLLSETPNGVLAQLELVQVYCDGSGAKLNLSKSSLLSLNRTKPCPIIPDLTVLGPEDSVKYLGIPFGQKPTHSMVISTLDKRFYDGFGVWFRRARTVRGRLLVAQTMILSRLWHYTMHVDIPGETIRQWQSMLNRFVLGRKHKKDARHVHLISKEFLYLRRQDGGLQVPFLVGRLKLQRIQFLQQFASDASTIVPANWTTASTVLLQLIQPSFGPHKPMDIFTIAPHRHGKMVQWESTSSWWKHAFKMWHQMDWSTTISDLNVLQRRQYYMEQPMWFHCDRELHYEAATRNPSTQNGWYNLGMVDEPHRTFRKSFATHFEIRSLHDFFRESDMWPTKADFVDIYYNDEELNTSNMAEEKLLSRLYDEVTQILQRIHSTFGRITWITPNTSGRFFYVGVQSKERKHYFPYIPRSQLSRIV